MCRDQDLGTYCHVAAGEVFLKKREGPFPGLISPHVHWRRGLQGFRLDCVICAAFLRDAMDTRRRCEAWDGCPPRCLRVPSLLTLCSDTCASPGTSLIPPQRCLHGASGGTQAASQCPAPAPSVWHGPQNLGSGVDADCLLSPGGTGRVFPLGRSGYCQPGPRGIVLLFWQQNLRNCEERPSGSTLYCLRF